MTAVGEMVEQMDRPRLTNSTDPDTIDALRHHDSIIDAWQHRGRESVGTPMAVKACSTTKGRRTPVRRGHGTMIAGPRGIIYTPPTGEDRRRDRHARCRRAGPARWLGLGMAVLTGLAAGALALAVAVGLRDGRFDFLGANSNQRRLGVWCSPTSSW